MANIAAPAFGIYDLAASRPTTSNVYGALEVGTGVTALAFNIGLLSSLDSDCDCGGLSLALVGGTAVDVAVAIHGLVTIVRDDEDVEPIAFSVGRARVNPVATTGIPVQGPRCCPFSDVSRRSALCSRTEHVTGHAILTT